MTFVRFLTPIAVLVGLLVGLNSCTIPKQAEPVTVACAASVADAIKALGEAYSKQTGVDVIVVPGATGLLARQLREGAPYDAFFSADEETARALVGEGLLSNESVREYARGEVVLAARPGGVFRADAEASLRDATALRIVAIPQPETAPYGRAAKAWLTSSKLEETLGSRLVISGDVGATMSLLKTGNADAAFVPRQLAEAAGFAILPLPGAAPVVHLGAGSARGPRAAEGAAFVAFCAGPAGANLLPGRTPTGD